MEESKARIDSGRFSISWPTLALTLGVATIASLGALVIIATVKDVDVLSTVALALAILAFAAQIIVLLAQSQSAAQQLAGSERVNAETRGLMAQIGVQSASLLANQSGQFDRVLEAALGTESVQRAVSAASPESESDGPHSEIDAEALSTALRWSVRGTIAGDSNDQPANPYADFVSELTSWPREEESEQALEVLRSLKPMQTALLVRRAQSDLRKARLGLEPMGWSDVNGKPGPSNTGLVELGIFDYTPAPFPRDGTPALKRRLTPLGRTIARLLNVGDVPAPPKWLVRALGEA